MVYYYEMELKQYLSELLPADREAFAVLCGTSAKHLKNVADGFRPLDEKVCVAVEKNSHKKVTRQELKPTDWRLIWPELVIKRKTKSAA